jgi:GT2 family glycosyltransferase
VAAKHFVDPEVVAIGGPAVTPPQDSFWQRVSGAVFLSRFTGGAPERYVPMGNVRIMDDWPSVNLMVRRGTFLDVGGFDCRYWPGEDTKLCLKLIRTGKKLLYVPNLVVWHHRRAGFRAHLRQVGGYGLHRGYFARHYPQTSLRLKYFAPSAFVFFALATFFSSWVESLTWPIGLGWFAYGAVLALGFRDIFKFESLSVAVITLIYIPVTHLYYGIQFMRGFLLKGELVSELR